MSAPTPAPTPAPRRTPKGCCPACLATLNETGCSIHETGGELLDALRVLLADISKHAHGQPAPGHAKHIEAAQAAVIKAEGHGAS